MMFGRWNGLMVAGVCVGMSLIQGCNEPPVRMLPPDVLPVVRDVNTAPEPDSQDIPSEPAYTHHYKSSVWVGDQGDGTYRNPILFSDYANPDVCRVGPDYYMTAASFSGLPGLPILHSKDLVNWELIGHALPYMVPEDQYSQTRHDGGAWAPSIRYHQNEFYIYWGDPDLGICMVKAEDPEGPWSRPEVVKAGKGLIDPCPLWDDDGQVYLVHAWSASHAEISSLFTVHKLSPDGTRVIDAGRHVFDGHVTHPASEGAKFYKHEGSYYIMASCNGPAHGWQVALRSESIYGPYQDKMVLIQSNTPGRGHHQGAWVQTESGEFWFVHSQHRQPYGRVICLEPGQWVDGWPIMGVDSNGNGCGEPVTTYAKPLVQGDTPIVTPVESDEFNGGQLGLQWQWCANPDIRWSVMLPDRDYLRLMALKKPDMATNFWSVPNLLLQRMPGPTFTATTKMTFSSPGVGRHAGIIVFGRDYAYLGLSGDQGNFTLSKVVCENAHKGGNEQVVSRAFIGDDTLFLRVTVVADEGRAQFSYSLDGDYYVDVGDVFRTREGNYTGARVGLFCTSDPGAGSGGYSDFDWFRIEQP